MGLLARSAATFGITAVALLFAVHGTNAAEYPSRTIRFIVPFAAGGPTDVLARLTADYVSRDLKQSAVVENKPGANGAIAAETVARADPDGYTLFVTAASIIVLNPLLYKNLPYDPAKDLRMLAIMTDVPLVMVVHPSVPAKTIAEFVAYAKQNPAKLNFGSSGTGGTVHLAGEMFKQTAGVEMTHVPYKGAGPALTDVIAGNLQVMFESISTTQAPIKAGLLRPLGISSKQRHVDLPDVPTIAESGYPDYEVSVWFGVAASAKLPNDVVDIVTNSLNRALNDEAFRASLQKTGYTVLKPRSRAEIMDFLDAERARWSAVVKTLSISLD